MSWYFKPQTDKKLFQIERLGWAHELPTEIAKWAKEEDVELKFWANQYGPHDSHMEGFVQFKTRRDAKEFKEKFRNRWCGHREGDKTTILVEGKPYETIIIDGVQRFPKKLMGKLWDLKLLNLNDIALEFQCNKSLTLEEYIQLNMDLGYSVIGFSDCMKVKIENPLWEEEYDSPRLV